MIKRIHEYEKPLKTNANQNIVLHMIQIALSNIYKNITMMIKKQGKKKGWPFEGLWGHHSHCSTSGPQGPAYRYRRPWPPWARPGTTAARSRRPPAPAASDSHSDSAAPPISPSTFAASLAPIRLGQPRVSLFPGPRLGFAIWVLRVSAFGVCPVTRFWRILEV